MPTNWLERMDALRRKREAAGKPSGRTAIAEQIREADSPDDYRPNRLFDYAADIAAYPLTFRPRVAGLSVRPAQWCSCREPLRALKPSSTARLRFCAACLAPDESEPGDWFGDLAAACRTADRDPLRAAALSLTGLADALDAPEPVAPKRSTRSTVSLAAKRLAVLRLRSGETSSRIAEDLGVNATTVRQWASRAAS